MGHNSLVTRGDVGLTLLYLQLQSDIPGAVPRCELTAFLVDVIATVLTLQPLLEDSHEDLVAEVTLGRLGVGVHHEGVRDLQSVGQVKVHPGRPPCNRGEAGAVLA